MKGRMNITHAKIVEGRFGLADGKVAMEGIRFDALAYRITFAVDRDVAERIERRNPYVPLLISDALIISDRLETMDEHFNSPYYEETDPFSGRARND